MKICFDLMMKTTLLLFKLASWITYTSASGGTRTGRTCGKGRINQIRSGGRSCRRRGTRRCCRAGAPDLTATKADYASATRVMQESGCGCAVLASNTCQVSLRGGRQTLPGPRFQGNVSSRVACAGKCESRCMRRIHSTAGVFRRRKDKIESPMLTHSCQ